MSEEIEALKKAFLDADREYQYALGSGDKARIKKALQEHRRTFDALNKAKRKQFKTRENHNKKL